MASILHALERIKRNPLEILDRRTIERVCKERHHSWRERELDPATTLALFMQQILHGNVPCSEVRHLAKASFTPQAYCQARQRLPLEVVQALFGDACQALAPLTGRGEHRWRGHRTFHVDGSGFSMPDTPELQKAFGMPYGPRPGCGFPVAHLLVLFNARTGLLLDAWASPRRTGDVSRMPEVHQRLNSGDVLIGDDAFSTYANLALLLQANLHGLFPVHHKRIVDFTRNRPHVRPDEGAVRGMTRSRWIKSLGPLDQLVEYARPKTVSKWMSPEEHEKLPPRMVVREIRRTVRRPGQGPVTVTMVTTLLDPEAYPAEELLGLRLRRWDVETNLGHLKTTMKMDVLHSKSEAGVRKELAVFCLVYNLVRVAMLQAAERQATPVSRISFSDTLKWMRHARPGDAMPELLIVPYRPNRLEPRCKKRRAKEYDLMNKPRGVLRNRLIKQGKNA